MGALGRGCCWDQGWLQSSCPPRGHTLRIPVPVWPNPPATSKPSVLRGLSAAPSPPSAVSSLPQPHIPAHQEFLLGAVGSSGAGLPHSPPLCSLQPGPGQSRGCHGFHRAHDPAHLPHAASRGRADPLQNGLAFFHVIPSIPTLPLPGAAEERPGAGNCPLSARPPPLERHGEAQGTLQQ